MARDSHTISRFKGINTIDSDMNAKPYEGRSCLNTISTPSGQLWAMRNTTIVIDFTLPNTPLSTSRILSLGLLDDQVGGNPPRLVIQIGGALAYSDAPDYADTAACTGLVLAGTPSRLSYAQSASVLYFANRLAAGKLLPGDSSVYRWGIAQPLTSPAFVSATTTMLEVVAIQRSAGVVTLQFGLPHGSFIGDPVYVDSQPSATWDLSFAGLFPIASVPAADTVTYAQPGLPDAGPFARTTFTEGLTAATGYLYRFSAGFTKTAHWSTASLVSTATGPLMSQSPVLLLPAQTDPQVNQFAVFRNLNDGGDWFLEDTLPALDSGPFAGRAVYLDLISDDTLESSAQTPPYDNGVAPPAKYLCASLDRILACGITSNPNAVAYSGYDSINFGRPQESWPTFNSIAIGQGETAPNGIGLTRYGAVVFTSNSDLYIIRGTLSDVTVSAPTPPSFVVQHLPFRIGCYSHFSIQATSSGLIFLDDALRLMLFDGYYEPQLINPALAAVLARVTPGTQDVVASMFVKLEDRQWYILSVPVDGSLQNNLTIVVDRTADEERNTGSWLTTLSLDDIVSVLNRDGTRHLLCAESQRVDGSYANLAGWVTSFPLTFSPADDPSTLTPSASWLSGYFGIKDEDGLDEFSFIKLFRYIQATCDVGLLKANVYLVDRDTYTFDNPLVLSVDFETATYGGVNLKARAMAIQLIFAPGTPQPVDALTVAWNMVSKR